MSGLAGREVYREGGLHCMLYHSKLAHVAAQRKHCAAACQAEDVTGRLNVILLCHAVEEC